MNLATKYFRKSLSVSTIILPSFKSYYSTLMFFVIFYNLDKRTAPGICAYYLGAQWNMEGLPACSQVCVRCSKRLLTDIYVVNSGNSATTKFEPTLDICSPQRSDGKKCTVVARSTAVADDSYSDFNFWRVPIPNLDE